MWLCKKSFRCRGVGSGLAAEQEPAKADIAYEAILAILYACRVPEQQISDQDLMHKLNLGRTRVREALCRLAAEGKIQWIPQRGFFTRPMVEGALVDLYDHARDSLVRSLTRMRPQVLESWTVSDESSPDELASVAEAIFTRITEGAANCEACKYIQRFCFNTHALRMEITTSELRPNFVGSLAGLSGAMSQIGTAKSLVESALLNHLELEMGAVSRVVREVNERGLTRRPR